MALDPRKTFTIKNTCPAAGVAANNTAAKKKRFLDNITKVGDLEVLNDIGGGDVGKGLRVLGAVSDSIRTGKSVVPGRENTEIYNSTLGKIVGMGVDAVSEGTQTVLDTVGLGSAIEAVGDINTGAANRGYEAASQVYKRVKDGNLDLEDIPELFADLQNVETLFRGIFPGTGGSEKANPRSLCGVTPYAMDLIAFAPKFQFMFIVEIEYAVAYADLNQNAQSVAFVVKTSTRPKFNIDYEEINMYGFRTRVPRRVEYQPMEMSFYDDNQNAALNFYVTYMRAMSPIANWKNNRPQQGDYELNGMNYSRAPSSALFTRTSSPTSGHSASSGPLVGDTTSLIKEIKIHHVFQYGNKMNTYHFYNPRITAFVPSDLTMAETGDGCEFSFEFAYDGVYIDHMVDLSLQPGKLTTLTDLGSRPIVPIYDEGGTESGEGEPDHLQAEEDAPQYGFLGNFTSSLSKVTDGITDTFGNVIGGVGTQSGQSSNTVNPVIAGSNKANMTSGLTGARNQNISAAQKSVGGLGVSVSNGFKSEDTMAAEAKALNDTYNQENLLS